MKTHRIEVQDTNLNNWMQMRSWLALHVGDLYYSCEYLSSNDAWLFSFFYEEDKVKFILRWV